MRRFLRYLCAYLCAPMVGQQRLLASDLPPTVLAERIRALLKSGTWIGWAFQRDLPGGWKLLETTLDA